MPIEHLRTDALVLGMAERYDVLVDVGSAASQRMVALPLGKPSRAIGILCRAGTTSKALPAGAPVAIPGRVASYSDMKDPAPPAALTDVARRGWTSPSGRRTCGRSAARPSRRPT